MELKDLNFRCIWNILKLADMKAEVAMKMKHEKESEEKN